LWPRLKDNEDDDAERGGDREYTEDGENEADVDVDGGGVIFLTPRLVMVALGEVENGPRALDDDGDFSLTGDNPWINVDHGAICLAISEAAALLAAVALLTVTVFALFTLASSVFFVIALLTALLLSKLEFEPEYPRLCAYGLKELIDDDPLGRSVFFNGLSATLRCWTPPLVAVVVLVLAPVGVAPSLAAIVNWVVFDTTEDTAEDTAEEPATEGEAFNGVALGVLPGVACRSRTLISMARSFVAASRMERTPV